MKKILILSEYFYPYNSTGAPKIIGEIAEDLVKKGLSVEVITSKKNYNAPAIKNLKKEEIYNGVKINRVWSVNSDKNSKVKRILSYLSLSLSFTRSVLVKKDYDYLLIFSSPPISTIIGHLANKIRKKDYAYVVHDLYPEIAYNLNVIKKDGFIGKIMDYTNKKAFETSKNVIAIGRDMEEVLISKGCKKEKIKVITNWADSSYIYPVKKDNRFSREYNLQDTFNIIYTGNIGRFHDLETLVYTAEELKEYKNINFIIIGEGYKKEKILNMKKEKNLDNLYILGYQDSSIYNEVLSTADLLVSSLEEGVEGLAVPSKTYSYFAANKPVVAIMNESSEIARTINENQIGICIQKNDHKKLAKFIINLNKNKEEYKLMVQRTKVMFDQNYERNIVTDKFKDLINS